jgi:hypothetical protein
MVLHVHVTYLQDCQKEASMATSDDEARTAVTVSLPCLDGNEVRPYFWYINTYFICRVLTIRKIGMQAYVSA